MPSTKAPLVLAADPVAAMEAATKQYVDSKAGGGGSSNELAYVESSVTTSITTGMTEAAPQTILTLPATTFDGSTPVVIEAELNFATMPPGSGLLGASLWDMTANIDLGRLMPQKAVGVFKASRKLTPAAGTITYAIRCWTGSGSSGAGSIAGDVGGAGKVLPLWARITKDPIVGPTGPQGPAGASQPSVPRGTSLPSSPADGDEYIYIADATNGVEWHLKYRSGSASPYKWEFVGGGPLMAVVTSDDLVNSGGANGTFYDSPNVCSVTLPLAGDYEFDIFTQFYGTGGGTTTFALVLGAVAASSSDGAGTTGMAGGVNDRGSLARTLRRLGISASTVAKLQFKTSNNIATYRVQERSLFVRPIRVA